MKKIIALLLALVMVLGLVACGDKTETPANNEPAGNTESNDRSDVTIALITPEIGVNPFLVSMADAVKDLGAKYGCKTVIAECKDDASFEENARSVVLEGCSILVGGGWQTGDALQKVATEYPDACAYVLIDSEVEAENVRCINYYEQEGAYLIGKLAAYTVDGDSHMYGSVHVNTGAGSWKWRWGYMMGVLSVDPDAEFAFRYTASYSDTAIAKEYALQLYELGCLFVNSACSGGAKGVFEACLEKGFYTSSQDIDETDPANPYIVSSQMKDTYNSVTLAVEEFLAGNWTTENATWGVKEGTIGAVYVTHESPNPRSDRLTDEEIADLKDTAEKIRTGELDLVGMFTDEETWVAAYPNVKTDN